MTHAHLLLVLYAFVLLGCSHAQVPVPNIGRTFPNETKNVLVPYIGRTFPNETKNVPPTCSPIGWGEEIKACCAWNGQCIERPIWLFYSAPSTTWGWVDLGVSQNAPKASGFLPRWYDTYAILAYTSLATGHQCMDVSWTAPCFDGPRTQQMCWDWCAPDQNHVPTFEYAGPFIQQRGSRRPFSARITLDWAAKWQNVYDSDNWNVGSVQLVTKGSIQTMTVRLNDVPTDFVIWDVPLWQGHFAKFVQWWDSTEVVYPRQDLPMSQGIRDDKSMFEMHQCYQALDNSLHPVARYETDLYFETVLAGKSLRPGSMSNQYGYVPLSSVKWRWRSSLYYQWTWEQWLLNSSTVTHTASTVPEFTEWRGLFNAKYRFIGNTTLSNGTICWCERGSRDCSFALDRNRNERYSRAPSDIDWEAKNPWGKRNTTVTQPQGQKRVQREPVMEDY